MAQFNYADYAATVAAAQNKNKSSGVKVGFLKLGDGEDALIRFNVSAIQDLSFASIHKVKRTPDARFPGMSISCLNPLGKTGQCPLCAAVEAGDDRVQKVGKRVYAQALVSYKNADGTWAKAVPVIVERAAGFYKELEAYLNDYGDLKKKVFKIHRSGNGMETKYSFLYLPAFDTTEKVSDDFSAFEGFNIAKHSYWEKTVEECEYYLEHSEFPETVKADTEIKTEVPVVKTTPVVEQPKPQPKVEETKVEEVKEEPKKQETSFGTNFGGFSF